MGLEACEQATEKQQKELEHDRPTLADDIQKSTFSTAYGVFATHRRLIRRTPGADRSIQLQLGRDQFPDFW
jgi:hypothetical protein